jgi:ribonuclease HI
MPLQRSTQDRMSYFAIPDGLNHLYRTKPCSNHSIELHHGQLTSRWMEDHNTHSKTQAKLNIIKDQRLVRQLMTAGLSNYNNYKSQS